MALSAAGAAGLVEVGFDNGEVCVGYLRGICLAVRAALELEAPMLKEQDRPLLLLMQEETFVGG